MNNLKRFIIYWVPFILYVVCIFAVSSLSLTTRPVPVSDKVVHSLEYCILAFFLSRAVGQSLLPYLSWGQVVPVVIIASLVGALDEYSQSFTPGRFPSVFDWYADLAGIFGMITILLIRRHFREVRPEVL